MRTIYFVLMLLCAGCATAPSAERLMTDEAIRQGFAGASSYSTEHDHEIANPDWLEGRYTVTEEHGDWMRPGESRVLVTLDLEETSHVSGLVHHLAAVFDPETHERLSPVFHYISDHLTQRSIHRFSGWYSVLYIGYVQQGPYVRHVSGHVRFHGGELRWEPCEIDDEIGHISE